LFFFIPFFIPFFSFLVSQEYLAPELVGVDARGEYSPYTEKCDLWALGILLYKMCFAEFPFPSANFNNREIAQVLQEICSFDRYANMSKEIIRRKR
jgi:serine/threonine protein kinase